MFEIVCRDPAFGSFDRVQLLRLKLRAMRAGVWFTALRRIDRVLIDLTLKVVRSVRSFVLARSILELARKLEGIMEGRLSTVVREVGFPLAQKLGLIAQKWGNASAESWASASPFAHFLAVMHINDPKIFKV